MDHRPKSLSCSEGERDIVRMVSGKEDLLDTSQEICFMEISYVYEIKLPISSFSGPVKINKKRGSWTYFMIRNNLPLPIGITTHVYYCFFLFKYEW
jgi:hypothetical protein